MKIAILTQPLRHNYGGLLQAYALQTVLRRMGHDPVMADRQEGRPPLRLMGLRLLSWVKCVVRIYLLHRSGYVLRNPFSRRYDCHMSRACDSSALDRFADERIRTSPRPIRSSCALRRYIVRGGFGAVVVGSDQVWREAYSPCITDYFLAFLPQSFSCRKVSYAASFGISPPDIASKRLSACVRGLQSFEALSVRESSGRDILRGLFRRDAAVALDPTMLLDPADWLQLAAMEEEPAPVFSLGYILDTSAFKCRVAEDLSARLAVGCRMLSIAPDRQERGVFVYRSVPDWLRSFASASYVVTDSFHGCVFAILFNKPFLAIANPDRGVDRFETLLGHFGLRERMVYSYEEYLNRRSSLLSPIDYAPVNARREQLKAASIRWLAEALAGEESTTLNRT